MARQQRYYENFAPQNPYMQRQYQDAQLQKAQADAQIAQYKANSQAPLHPLQRAVDMWADRYNQRGIYKGEGYLNDFFNNYGKPAPEVQGVITDNVPEGVKAQLQQQSVNDVGVANTGNGIGPEAPDLKDLMALDKRQYYVDKYLNSGTPNPDSDAITVKNTTKELEQMGDQIDFNKVDRSTLRRQADEMLKSKGLTNYQRGQVLSNFDNIYNEKVGKFNEAKGTDYLEKAKSALQEKDFDRADLNILAALRYSPDMAKAYMQFSNNMRSHELAKQRMALALKGGGPTGPGGVNLTSESNYSLDMANFDLKVIEQAMSADPSTSAGRYAIALARQAAGRLAQLGYKIKFDQSGKPIVSGGEKVPQQTYGLNVTNTDDDNYESNSGILDKIGSFFSGLVPEANTSGKATGWANGDFGPSIAERVLGYDPRKAN